MFYKVFIIIFVLIINQKAATPKFFLKLILKKISLKISLKNSVEEKSSFAKSLKIYSYFSVN